MFDQFVGSSSKRKNKRWLYFASTATVWLVTLATTIVAGIFAYDARLDKQFEVIAHVALPPPTRGAPDGKQLKAAKQQPSPRYSGREVPIEQPTSNRQEMPVIGVTEDIDGPSDPSAPPGVRDGVIDGSSASVPGVDKTTAPPPPSPREEKKEEQPAPVKTVIRKSSTILQGSSITQVKPQYPPIARAAGISGQVVVEVTINEEGSVISARALSGHALLKSVSEAAARGWKWRPTLLNDVPVKVIGTITFNFQL